MNETMNVLKSWSLKDIVFSQTIPCILCFYLLMSLLCCVFLKCQLMLFSNRSTQD